TTETGRNSQRGNPEFAPETLEEGLPAYRRPQAPAACCRFHPTSTWPHASRSGGRRESACYPGVRWRPAPATAPHVSRLALRPQSRISQNVHAGAGAVDQIDPSLVIGADVVRLNGVLAIREFRHIAADLLRPQHVADIDGAQAGVKIG